MLREIQDTWQAESAAKTQVGIVLEQKIRVRLQMGLHWVVGNVSLVGCKLVQIANDMVVALALPERARAVEQLIDFISRVAFDRMQNILQLMTVARGE